MFCCFKYNSPCRKEQKDAQATAPYLIQIDEKWFEGRRKIIKRSNGERMHKEEESKKK